MQRNDILYYFNDITTHQNTLTDIFACSDAMPLCLFAPEFHNSVWHPCSGPTNNSAASMLDPCLLHGCCVGDLAADCKPACSNNIDCSQHQCCATLIACFAWVPGIPWVGYCGEVSAARSVAQYLSCLLYRFVKHKTAAAAICRLYLLRQSQAESF